MPEEKMEVNDIRKKILEKIEREKSKASRKKKTTISLASLSAKMGKPEEDLRKLFGGDSTPSEIPHAPSEKEMLPECSDLTKEIEEKDAAIAELQEKLARESMGLIDDGGKGKSLINTAIEKSISEYRTKLALLEGENARMRAERVEELKKGLRIESAGSAESVGAAEAAPAKPPAAEPENKKLKKLHEDALKQNDSLLVRIEEKDARIRDLEKELDEVRGKAGKIKDHEKAVEEHRAERDKASANMETLRSKLYVATKEAKEQAARITQFEELLKHREKKLADTDKNYKNLESEKNSLTVKLQEAEELRRSLEEKIKSLSDEVNAKHKKASEAERAAAKTVEAARKEMDLQAQAIERNRKTLEGKVSHLGIELEAKDKRIAEVEESNAQLDNLVKESAVKLQAADDARAALEERAAELEAKLAEEAGSRKSEKSAADSNMAALRSEMDTLKTVIHDMEKSGEELKENILRLESEVESRDKKIQTDIKYCEDVVREVNDLRQKIKAYRLKVK